MPNICKHESCTYASMRGLRYETGYEGAVHRHHRILKYHPCCQNGNLCKIGRKVKQNGGFETGAGYRGSSRSILIPCLHTKCDRHFKLQKSCDLHIKQHHNCIDEFGAECSLCENNEEREELKKKEQQYAESTRKKYASAYAVDDEAWLINKENMEKEPEYLSPTEIFDPEDEPISDSELDPASLPDQDDSVELPTEKVKILPISERYNAIAVDSVNPRPCRAYCGFYGDPTFDGYCIACEPNNRFARTQKLSTRHARDAPKEKEVVQNDRYLPPHLLPTKSIKKKKTAGLPSQLGVSHLYGRKKF